MKEHMQKRTVLVTGGLGYIGSHTTVELIEEGFDVIIVDNLSNSEVFILERIKKITGASPLFLQKDLREYKDVKDIFTNHPVDVVIHFAAFKSVGESVREPLKYFQNNLDSLMNVLCAMQETGVKDLIFSSSATVYGVPDELPATEQTPFQKALSAYGSTKQIGEEILERICTSGSINNIH
jgi:UDP-glucose 4-epimerase